MKILPALAAGPLTGLLLYAGLMLADPVAAKDEPWLLQFRAAGFETHLYFITPKLGERIAVFDWRGKFADPRFEGSRLLFLDVDRVPIQIVELPSEALAKEVAAFKKNGRLYTVAQEQRFLIIIRPVNGTGVPAETSGPVIAAFREGVKQRP